MKAQIRIEFIFGILIFSGLIFFFSSQITTLFSTILQDSARDVMKGKAISTLTLLLEDPGAPDNWIDRPKSEVIRVGLADSPYKLNMNKINRLMNNNCELLERYDLGQYRLKITWPGSEILCGSRSLELPVVSVTRNAIIENDYGIVSLEMFQ